MRLLSMGLDGLLGVLMALVNGPIVMLGGPGLNPDGGGGTTESGPGLNPDG